jgi:hypothetical protein
MSPKAPKMLNDLKFLSHVEIVAPGSDQVNVRIRRAVCLQARRAVRTAPL